MPQSTRHARIQRNEKQLNVDLPEQLYKRVRMAAAHRFVPLKQWVREAVEEKLNADWKDTTHSFKTKSAHKRQIKIENGGSHG